MQNGLIDPVTLIFDLLTPKAYHLEYIPLEVIPYTKFEHVGIQCNFR